MHRLSALLLCSLFAAPALLLRWDRAVVRLPLAADGVPADWRLEDIARAVIPPDFRGSTYVLAWKRMADDRPGVVDYCLVLSNLADDEDWHIASLVRKPNGSRDEWVLAMVHYFLGFKNGLPRGVWVWHEECFSGPPSSRDVYRFADKYHWRFTEQWGFRVLDANVCESTWRAVLGEGPSRDFCRGLPRPGTRL